MDTERMLTITEQNRKLPKAYAPERVMSNAEELYFRIVEYFSLLGDNAHPTPPGLALAIGLTGFDSLMRIIRKAEVDPQAYPPESLNVLNVARSMLEDYYLDHGLREAIPAQFTKFIMSSFFNRNEKTIQEGTNLGGGNTTINVNILGISRPYEIDSAHPNSHLEAIGMNARPGFDDKVIEVDNNFNLQPGTLPPPVHLLGVDDDVVGEDDFDSFMETL